MLFILLPSLYKKTPNKHMTKKAESKKRTVLQGSGLEWFLFPVSEIFDNSNSILLGNY